MKYRELYPRSMSEGIGLLSNMAAYDVPWAEFDDFNLKALEQSYNLHSGFKEVIPSFAELPVADRAPAVLIHYLHKWKRYFNLYMTEYNPLSAYKVVESGNNVRTPDLQDLTTKGTKVVVAGSDSGTVTNVERLGQTEDNYRYGFNSQTAAPVDKSESGGENSVTETRDLTDSSTTTNSGSDTVKRTGTETTEHSVTKEGNIGYSTPQKLLREEMALWMKPYFDIVFSDIDNFIMINVF